MANYKQGYNSAGGAFFMGFLWACFLPVRDHKPGRFSCAFAILWGLAVSTGGGAVFFLCHDVIKKQIEGHFLGQFFKKSLLFGYIPTFCYSIFKKFQFSRAGGHFYFATFQFFQPDALNSISNRPIFRFLRAISLKIGQNSANKEGASHANQPQTN